MKPADSEKNGAAQPHVNRTWFRQGGTRRDFSMLVMIGQQSEPKRRAPEILVGR